MSQRQSAWAAAANVPRRRHKPSVRWLGGFEDLPTSLQDNNYIRRGYRIGYSTRDVLKSLFGWHNETGNIHTHLIGFGIFLALTVAMAYAVPSPFALGADAVGRLEGWLEQLRSTGFGGLTAHPSFHRFGGLHFAEWEEHLLHAVQHGRDSLADVPPRALKLAAALLGVEWPTARWPLFVFLAGAMACLLISATCHLLACCSFAVNRFIWRLDYAGIAILIVASFYPPVYYGFMCEPSARLFYLVSTTVLGLVCTAVALLDFFQSYQFRPLRAGMFSALGLWGIVPVLHSWRLHAGVPAVQRALQLDVLMGAIYLGGTALYAMRFPERLKPGRFDYLFNSHQLFHLAVVAAAFVHYQAVLAMLDWRNTTGGCSGVEPLLDAAATQFVVNSSTFQTAQ